MCNSTAAAAAPVTVTAAPGPAIAGVPAAHITHTALNPFVPNVSILRFPTGIFEMHLYLPGIVSKVEIVPHDNYLLVRGNLGPRLVQDVRGHVGTLVYTDKGSGEFSRDVPICLAPGTEFVVLETRQEGHDYIVRYTVRNSLSTGYCAGNAVPLAQPQIHAPSHGVGVTVQGSVGPVHGCGGVSAYGYGGYGHHGYHAVNPIINTLNTPRNYITHSVC